MIKSLMFGRAPKELQSLPSVLLDFLLRFAPLCTDKKKTMSDPQGCQRAQNIPLAAAAVTNGSIANSTFDVVGTPESSSTLGPSESTMASPTSPNGRESDDDGFVHVTKPMLTVRQFADWIQQTRLPGSRAVMQGTVEEDDTIQLLINRRSFMNDVLQSFRGKLSGSGSIDGQAWDRLWAQFLRDFPREEIHLAGEPLSAAEGSVETTVLPALREFVKSTIPPELLDLGAWRKRANAAVALVPKTSASTEAQSPTLSTFLNPFSLVAYVATAAARTVQNAASFSMSTHSPIDQAPDAGAGASPNDPAGEETHVPLAVPSSVEEVLENYTRLIVLMCQQSVLALPLEIINAQFCHDIEAQLYVGEVAIDDPRNSTSGMRITLDRMRNRQHGAVLNVAKLFRIFSVDDGVAYTLFYVDVRVELNIYADDEVNLQWKMMSAASPVHRVTTVHPGVASDAIAPRKCHCLGASSGYHKRGCKASQQ
jgi:hypothetical protein